jgi:hypothetical protein
MPELITGPSGGVLGKDGGIVTQQLVDRHPDLARQFVTIGQYPRAGHDRERWETVNWDDYRAHVGVQLSAGPWRIDAIESTAGDVTSWIAEAQGMPVTPPGWYTALMHKDRGLVMCDVPGEIAGALPFLDAATLEHRRLLITGLGLGILPAWLLATTSPWRIDIVEIDPDVIELITRDCREQWAPNAWAADPRLHIHHGDAHTWWPAGQRGCALHQTCRTWGNATWHAAFFDIWDTISPHNLPSMHRLHRRFGRRVAKMWSWERAECEAMRGRGQTLERPCWVSETGYPLNEETPGA